MQTPESSIRILPLISTLSFSYMEIVDFFTQSSSASSSCVICIRILCSLILSPSVFFILLIVSIFSSFRANRKKEVYCCVRYNKQNARKDSVLPVIFSCVRGGSCPHIMKPSFSCNYACHARLISSWLLKLISSTFREHPFSRRSAPLWNSWGSLLWYICEYGILSWCRS